MKVVTERINLSTRGFTDIINITDHVQAIVERSGLEEGSVVVFVRGSTASITTIEYEPGLVKKDFAEFMEKIAPYRYPYEHHKMWGDDNGAAHLRASLVGPSVVVPFVNGELLLGTWQQIVLIDFDTRPRDRTVFVQVMGV